MVSSTAACRTAGAAVDHDHAAAVKIPLGTVAFRLAPALVELGAEFVPSLGFLGELPRRLDAGRGIPRTGSTTASSTASTRLSRALGFLATASVILLGGLNN